MLPAIDATPFAPPLSKKFAEKKQNARSIGPGMDFRNFRHTSSVAAGKLSLVEQAEVQCKMKGPATKVNNPVSRRMISRDHNAIPERREAFARRGAPGRKCQQPSNVWQIV
jgi:hypothetical protein